MSYPDEDSSILCEKFGIFFNTKINFKNTISQENLNKVDYSNINSNLRNLS